MWGSRRWLAGLVIVCAAAPASAEPYFELVPGSPLGTAAEWTNYLALADLDRDSDLDLLVPNCGGFFSSPQPQPFRIYRNQDGGFVEATAEALGAPWTAAVRVVAVADIDGDGDVDFAAPAADGAADRLYVNDGSGTFVDEASARLPGATSSSAGARFGDVDGDGDLDLLVTQGYAAPDDPVARLYLNDGAGVFADAPDALPATMDGVDPDDVDFADVDRDFDLDVLVNAHNGRSALWRNDGAGLFTDASADLPAPNGGPFHYGPSACDVDGDGDLDLWVDNTAPGGREQLLINDGNGVFTDQTTPRVSQNPAADDNAVYCADVDADGDLDAVVASLSGNERVLENDGAGKFVHVPDSFPAVSDPTLWMDFGDLDGDGRIDVVTGQGEGSPRVNRVYTGSPTQPVDMQPPRIVASQTVPAVVAATETPVVRFAVSDSVVTDSGPRLQGAFARVDTGSGDNEIAALFVGGDLFRVVLPVQPAGTAVDVTLCATDPRGNEACAPPQHYVVAAAGSDHPADELPPGEHRATGCASAGAGGGSGATAIAVALAALWCLVVRRRRSHESC